MIDRKLIGIPIMDVSKGRTVCHNCGDSWDYPIDLTNDYQLRHIKTCGDCEPDYINHEGFDYD